MNRLVSTGVVTGVVVLALTIALAVVTGLGHVSQSAADPLTRYQPFVPCLGGFPREVDPEPCYSLSVLKQSAHAIVEGTVVSAEQRDIDISDESDPLDPDPTPFWVSSIRVDKVVKGDLSAGDVVDVQQMITGDAIWMGRTNDRGVLFLKFSPEQSQAWPVNPVQGVVPYIDGFAFLGQYNEVSPRDRLTEDEFTRLVRSLK